MLGLRRERALVVLIGSVHFVQHTFRILPPVLPLLVVAYPYPLWKLGALVSVYFLGSGLGQIPMGILVDRYDRRYILAPSIALMGVGYLGFALAPGLVAPGAAGLTLVGESFTLQFLLMCLGVFVAGVGASAIHPAGYPLVIANAPPDRVGRALGAWGSAAKFGDAAAPTAIALLVLLVTWREIFLLFGVVGVVYAAGFFLVTSADWIETRPPGRRPDTAAGDDASTADDAGETAAEPAENGEDTSDATDTSSGDWRADRRHYVYPMLTLFVFFVARAFSEKGLKAFLPTFISEVYGYTFTFAGLYVPPESFADLYFTAVFLVAGVTTLVTGRLVDRFDARTVLLSFFGTAALALAVFATGVLSPVALLAVLLVLGATNWGWVPARDAIISDVAPAEREGRTFGYLHAISHLFSAVAPVAVGFVAEERGFRRSFLLLTAVMLVAIASIAALYSGRIYRPLTDETQPVDSD